MTLKSFPRGGKKPLTKPKFGLTFSKKEAPAKAKKSHGNKSKEPKPFEEENNYLASTAECLNYSALGEGMVVMGRISETTEYDMTVSLPGRLSGRIQATDISNCYTTLLRSIVKSDGEQTEEFKPLSELYKRGEYVTCYVKSVNPGEKWRLSLSLEPELINRNLDPSKLRKHSKIVGTIDSLEDHGYVVDTGNKNLRSFLGTTDIDEGVKYYPGKQIICAVKKVKTTDDSTTTQLSTKVKHVETSIIEDGQSLDAHIPGTSYVLTVQRILSNGLQITFNNGNIGYANVMYLDKPLESYDRGSEIHGTLMYILPTVKFAYFTVLPLNEEEERLNVGDMFDSARVLYIGSKGIVVSLKKGIRGLIPFRRTAVGYEQIAGKFLKDTTHKCRVLAYDSFERVYVCTMERDLLQEKHFATSSLLPGEILDVEIAKIQSETGFVMVTAGRTKGWVPPEHLQDPDAPTKNKIKIGDVVKARVLGRDRKGKGVLLTLKKSLIDSSLPILKDMADAKVGGKHHGTVVQITPNGVLLCFYDTVKGWISSKSLDSKSAATKWNLMVGQVVMVKVQSVKREENKLTLTLFTEKDVKTDEPKFEIGETIEGIVVEASVEGVYLRITKSSEESPRTGFLPAGHIAPCEEVGSYLAARYSPGETLSALVFAVQPRFILTRTFIPQEKFRDFEKLNVGDCLPCSIHESNANGLKLLLPIKHFTSYGLVPRYNTDNFESLRTNQMLFAKITAINRKKRKITLTTSLHGVWNDPSRQDNDLIASVDVLTLHLNKLHELSQHEYYKNKPISKAKIGERVKGVVDKVTEHGLVLKLDNDVLGTVRQDHYQGKVKPGDEVNGTILWVNYIHDLVEVTLLPSVINSISTKQNRLSNVSLVTPLRGDIVLVTNWFVLVVLKGAGKGVVAAIPTRRHINDTEPDLKPYGIGKRVRCYLVINKGETDLLPICLVKSSFETTKIIETIPEKKNLKRKTEGNGDHENSPKKIKAEVAKPVEKATKKKKKKNLESEKPAEEIIAKKIKPVEKTAEEKNVKKGKSAVTKTVEEKSTKKKGKKEVTEKESKPEVPTIPEAQKSKKNLKRAKAEELKKAEEKKTLVDDEPVKTEDDSSEDDEKDTKETIAIPECGFFWDNKPDATLVEAEESSSDDDEDVDNEPKNKKKKKKLSAAERREAERQKEREIREREEALASNEAPNSVDQFDRLVLSSPDSSMIWLQYMAYHLQATEIDKARAIAKRAIKTINFREEIERLNVWQAWLNLESRFGTAESLNEVFQEALKANNAMNIYLHMLTVHVDAGRQVELEKIITPMVRKFREIPKVWFECGMAYLKMGLKDKSRHIMQRALQCLPAPEHVNLMVKFARMELTFGDKERAQTLFDQVLSSYPKRVDVWGLYIDVLVKSGNVDEARKVLEKAIVQTLPARKMKTLFKKFIDFEKVHGSPEGVANVQQLALKYVENQCNKESV